MAESNIRAKLIQIQSELKAPKGQFNKFGNYAYRSCEDILEAAKPLANKYGCALVLSDEVVNVGDRYYVKATATLYDAENSLTAISNSAFAREAETKKGMDESQITGAASSYARKYALNGLFAIDDTKDADTNEHRNQTNNAPKDDKIDAQTASKLKQAAAKCSDDQKNAIKQVLVSYGYKSFDDIKSSDCQKITDEIKKAIAG